MFKIINKIIKRLVIFLSVSLINTTLASEQTLILPQRASEPVSIQMPAQMSLEDIVFKGTGLEIKTSLLQVFVGDAATCCETRTPISGRYTVQGNKLTFSPAFGFVTGQTYQARVRIPNKDERLVSFTIEPDVANVEARVAEIFPSGDSLPENVLRFYIHFSTPMSPHVAFDYIKLRDSSGKADEAAFMRFKQELWNEDRTRLTVLMDPGRIKREVATNVQLGPALIANHEYTLSVETGWPSANGSSVLSAFDKTFSVSNALRKRPNVHDWQVNSPCFATSESLTIEFDRPFDRQLLSKHIHVLTPAGSPLKGAIKVSHNEHTWRFVPEQPWANEAILIVADEELEDVAGNNFRDLLDIAPSAAQLDVSPTRLQVSVARCSD